MTAASAGGAHRSAGVVEAGFAELSVRRWHDIVRLRVDVFVVEQACAYPELDGRDVEAGSRHCWIDDAAGLAAYLRVLVDPDATRIGRIVTRPDARRRGLAGRLLDHVLATRPGPFAMAAQAHLVDWYARRGFTPVSAPYDEDGIPHVDLARPVRTRAGRPN